MPIGKNLVSGADSPTPQSPYATADNNMYLVHLAGRHFPITSNHSTKTKITRWQVTSGHRSEMHDVILKPHMDVNHTRMLCNSRVDANVETDRNPGKTTARE
jgi:hypothetical protein